MTETLTRDSARIGMRVRQTGGVHEGRGAFHVRSGAYGEIVSVGRTRARVRFDSYPDDLFAIGFEFLSPESQEGPPKRAEPFDCGCPLPAMVRDDGTCSGCGAQVVQLPESQEGGAMSERLGMPSPTVVCLCGSTRWPQAFELANMHESLRGRICISVGMHGHADRPMGARFLTSDGDEMTDEKQALDRLHFRKIDLADEILVINVAGYVGASTQREIAYAIEHGKAVRWLFPDAIPVDLTDPAALSKAQQLMEEGG